MKHGIPHERDQEGVFGEFSKVEKEWEELLDARFGHTVNSKGYRVLNNVRVIQGDGINLDSIESILWVARDAGYPASNVAFGMGGALLQQHNRDTQRFAMKCSCVTVNDEEVAVYKNPVDDPGKQSMMGRLDLVRVPGGGFSTVRMVGGEEAELNTAMRTVYENGKLLVDDSLAIIRERANSR